MRVRVLLSILRVTCPGMAAAQFGRGQIVGGVRDQSGSATPGATITVENEGDGEATRRPLTRPPLHDDTPLRMCWHLRWEMRDLQAGEQT